MGNPIPGKAHLILKRGPGPRLKIQTVFAGMVPMLKIDETVLSLTWEFLYRQEGVFILRRHRDLYFLISVIAKYSKYQESQIKWPKAIEPYV